MLFWVNLELKFLDIFALPYGYLERNLDYLVEKELRVVDLVELLEESGYTVSEFMAKNLREYDVGDAIKINYESICLDEMDAKNDLIKFSVQCSLSVSMIEKMFGKE